MVELIQLWMSKIAVKRVVLATLSTIPLCALAAPDQVGVNDQEIIIGQTMPLEGGKNSYAAAVNQGMKLYFDNVNAAGGINGRKINRRVLDDDNKPAIAESNARKLVEEGAFVLFGPIDGGLTAAVMKVANETQVPLIGPLAGPPTLRQPYQALVFPVRAEHKDEFSRLLMWAKSTNYKTVGFLHADTEVGNAHLRNVNTIASALGMTVTLALPFKNNPDAAQIEEMARSILQVKPDVFINHGNANLYRDLIIKAKDQGSKTVFAGVNSGSFQIASALGARATGMVFSQVVPSPWERKRAIAREYQDAMRKADPNAELSYGSLEGYMTAKLLVKALRGSGKKLTRAGLIKTLQSGPHELGGVSARYSPGNHEGSHYVDLSIVGTKGKFMH
jgi:branched-chain amino acid transport system substrate-binding protein